MNRQKVDINMAGHSKEISGSTNMAGTPKREGLSFYVLLGIWLVSLHKLNLEGGRKGNRMCGH